MQIKSNQQRISLIKGMMKSIFFVVLLFLVVLVFWPSHDNEAVVLETSQIKIKSTVFNTRSDYMQVELVSNRPLLIIKYNEEDKACLGLKNNTDTDWFVAWAQGSDLGCPLQRIDAKSATQRLGYEVCRGLQDQCRGSIYDLKGVVYIDQLATKNLQSPNYSIKEKESEWFLYLGVATK